MGLVAFVLVIAGLVGGALWSSRTRPSNTNGDNITSATKYGVGL